MFMVHPYRDSIPFVVVCRFVRLHRHKDHMQLTLGQSSVLVGVEKYSFL